MVTSDFMCVHSICILSERDAVGLLLVYVDLKIPQFTKRGIFMYLGGGGHKDKRRQGLLTSVTVTNLFTAHINQTCNLPSHTWSFSRFLISVSGTTTHPVMQVRHQKSAQTRPLPLHIQSITSQVLAGPPPKELPHPSTALHLHHHNPSYCHLLPALLYLLVYHLCLLSIPTLQLQ